MTSTDKTTLARGCDIVAKSLKESYPETTREKIQTAHDNWRANRPAADIIERFAFDEFREHPNVFGKPDSNPLPSTGTTRRDSFDKNE